MCTYFDMYGTFIGILAIELRCSSHVSHWYGL